MTDATANPRAEPAWLKGALAGQRASLARAITAVEENTVDAACVLQAIYPLVGHALVVGFTGAPGSGTFAGTISHTAFTFANWIICSA